MAQDITTGFKKLVRNQCTPQEVDEVMDMINDDHYAALSGVLIAEELAEPVADHEISEDLRRRLDLRLKQILEDTNQDHNFEIKPTRTRKLWPRIGIAAAVVGLAVGIYFFTAPRHPELVSGSPNYANDVPPGTNAATLTLANGKKILINNAASGTLAEQHGVSISKTADGQIVYELKENKNGTKGYNTLQTSNGEQSKVRLQDGSLVNLNAASALTYPASFAGLKERRVKLKGEGHFTVHHNAKQPFRVETRGQVVEDIGTEFNINAYDDEAVVTTTLIEGLASVTPSSPAPSSSRGKRSDEGSLGHANNTVILRPNQQSTLSNNQLTLGEADPGATAWVKGKFQFNNTPLSAVMRQISRWYDVDIVYPDGIPDVLFSGDVNRNINASEVLKILQLMKVKFKIEGKKIIVNK